MDRLIALISRQSRGMTVVTFVVFWGATYLTTNHLPWRNPVPLFLLPFETTIPFLGWTVPIYLSVIPLAISVAWLVDRKNMGKGMVAAAGLVVIHTLIFLVFPTTYPRPTGLTLSPPLLDGLYRLMCMADSPRNCFPSLHVSLTTLVGMAVWGSRRRWRVIFAFWTLLIVTSTLTTKQHYALDALAGIAIGAMAHFIVFKQASRNAAVEQPCS